MRRTLASLGGLFLLAAASSADPCTPSATSLCLSDGRFEVSVAWKDFQSHTGAGQAVSLTADTGYFWFFSDSNVELIVKVLDARGLNGKFWVFFGALSNVEYTLTVRDSVTGASKTYHNPSGQFASVGDTSAFDGSAVTAGHPASHEIVRVTGTPTPPESIGAIQRFIDRTAPVAKDFAPCGGPGDRLFLAGCRFAVSVDWTTATGAGLGRPVQLTSDTGYFWFFNDTNVELMVKVLDARAINGTFWFFFGALSNVEYTITVTDTASGAVHAYHNPGSTFASVGDTGAFRGGFGVSVQTDDARTVSGTITAADGGSLSASAADGTVFTLTVPANAIASDQDISMTPVSNVNGLPFAGGLAAGVQLQPSGLVLVTGATLTIHTPAPIPSSEETVVAWNGSGEDFFLFPPTPVSGDLRLLIAHFAGYGVARGTEAERAAQLPREPLAEGDLLEHQSSPILRTGRVEALPAGSLRADGGILRADGISWGATYKAVMDARYILYRSEMANFDGDPNACIRLVLSVIEWKHSVEEHLGPLDTEFPGRREEIHSLFTSMVKKALLTLHTRCQTDARAINDIPALLLLASSQQLDVQLEADEAVHCLSFKLKFKSTMSASQATSQGVLVIGESVEGTVTLTTPRYPSPTKGIGSIVGTGGTVRFAPNDCSFPYTPSSTQLDAMISWANLFTGGGFDRLIGGPDLLALYYNVGFLMSTITVRCPETEPVPIQMWWFGLHVSAHITSADNSYSFKKEGFTLTGTQRPWATAHQGPPTHSGISNLTESTDFTLDHRPQ